MTEYINPIKGKFIYFAGRLTKIDYYQVASLLQEAGGNIRSQFNTKTTLVIVGSGRTNVREKAAAKGDVDVWDEDRLLLELERYNEHMANSARADTFDPLQSAFDETYYYVHRILGLPLASGILTEVLGDQFAYVVDHNNYETFWSFPGLASLQALSIANSASEQCGAMVEGIRQLPLLRALFIGDGRQPLDLGSILEDGPLLQALHIGSGAHLSADILRHANLEQLQLRCDLPPDITLCSFPKLTYFEARTEDAKLLNKVLNSGQFPRLRHIGLVLDNTANLHDFLSDIEFPRQIESVSLNFALSSPVYLGGVIQHVSLLPVAQQIQRLRIHSYHFPELLDNSLSSTRFPQLNQLKFILGDVGHSATEFMQSFINSGLSHQIHLDLSNCSLNSQQALGVLRWTNAVGPLESLNLRQNRINSQSVVERLGKANFPIDLGEQWSF